MNFREGFRRLYVLFGAFAMLFGASHIYKSIPDEAGVTSAFYYFAKEDVVRQTNLDSWRVTPAHMTNAQFLSSYCQGTLVYGDGKDKVFIAPNKPTCENHSNALKELPSEQRTEILYGVGYLIAGLAGLIAVYFTGRWIFNGFSPKK